MKADADWPELFFRNSFYNPASAEAVKAAPAEADFLCRAMKLEKGTALLDICCGPGRHAIEFARRGIDVTGYDFSAEYLDEARIKAEKNNLNILFELGDMRSIPYICRFDAAVSLFNSFGYFQDYKDDIKTLKGIFRALRPGGVFALDIVNGRYVRDYTGPYERTDLGSCWRIARTELDKDGMTCAWTFIDKKTGKSRSAVFFNRLYDQQRISDALKTAGFSVLKFYGDFSGGRLNGKKDRIIVISRKNSGNKKEHSTAAATTVKTKIRKYAKPRTINNITTGSKAGKRKKA